MANILYAKQIEDYSGNQLTIPYLRDFFSDAAELINNIDETDLRVAYFFIDPLMDTFEAGNKFYFEILGRSSIPKICFYRSGAGPIHALSDARMLIESGLYDIVSLFAYEPLQHNKKYRGKAEVEKAMAIFDNCNLIKCYNELASKLAEYLGMDSGQFQHLADLLYANYGRTYLSRFPQAKLSKDRGRNLADMGGELFRLTDCANPNIDYSGGIILGNDKAYAQWNQNGEKRIQILSAAHNMVWGNPERTDVIVGAKDDPFPHIRRAYESICEETGLPLNALLEEGKLLLNAYTCYPPIPLAFILACGFAKSAEEIPAFLEKYEITIDGGISYARAPWNCPALRSTILINEKLKESTAAYGLVHGNGGMGETQGLALLRRL